MAAQPIAIGVKGLLETIRSRDNSLVHYYYYLVIITLLPLTPIQQLTWYLADNVSQSVFVEMN